MGGTLGHLAVGGDAFAGPHQQDIAGTDRGDLDLDRHVIPDQSRGPGLKPQ